MIRRAVSVYLFAAATVLAQRATVTAVPPHPALPQHARHRVDLTNTYHRLICIVPMVGTGTRTDPRRPAYAPLPTATAMAAGKPLPRSGIVGFGFVYSDDKQHAIVEFVARSRTAFQAIFNDKTITYFEKGRVSRATIETALKPFRKDFSLDTFGMVMP